MPAIRTTADHVTRHRIVDAIVREAPRFVSCVAPAGFGKTALAADLARRFPDAAVFDCAAVDASDASAWMTTADDAELLVFDGVQALTREARAMLRGLFDALPATVRVVLCSRSSIVDVLPARLRPTEHLSITEHELRFGRDELREMFDDDTSSAVPDRIEKISRGWPLCVAMLTRAQRMRRLERLLSDPCDPEFRALHDYLSREVLAGLDESAFEILCALAVLGTAGERELALALGRDHLPCELIRALPLVCEERGRFAIHPVLGAFLTEHRRAQIAQSTVSILEARRQHRFLPLERAADLVGRLEPGILLRRPRLWVETVLYRICSIPPQQWFEEARRLWETVPLDADPETVAGVGYMLGRAYLARGEWERLDRFMNEVDERHARAGARGTAAAILARRLLEGRIRAVRLQPLDLGAFMREIDPLLCSNAVHAHVLHDVVSRVHAARGEHLRQRRALKEAVLRARRSEIPGLVAVCLQEAATAAWLRGHDERFEKRVSEIEALAQSEPSVKALVSHFLDCAGGRGRRARRGSERPHAAAFSWLIAAGSTLDVSERRMFLDEALRTADACRNPHAMLAARLAAAAAFPGSAYRLKEAATLLESAETTPYVRSLLQPGIVTSPLRPFLERFATRETRAGQIEVQVLDGTVRQGRETIRLSPKEFALLALLALRGVAVDDEVLAEALWPETALDAAKASLRVYVNRVRKRLGGEVVLADKGRYKSAASIVTDLQDIETFARNAARRPSSADVDLALQRYASLAVGPPAFVLDSPAFSWLHAEVNLLLELIEQWLRAACERVDHPDRARIELALEAHSSA